MDNPYKHLTLTIVATLPGFETLAIRISFAVENNRFGYAEKTEKIQWEYIQNYNKMIHSVPDNTSLLSILFYYRFLPVNLQKYTTTYDTQKLQINLTYGGKKLIKLASLRTTTV